MLYCASFTTAGFKGVAGGARHGCCMLLLALPHAAAVAAITPDTTDNQTPMLSTLFNQSNKADNLAEAGLKAQMRVQQPQRAHYLWRCFLIGSAVIVVIVVIVVVVF